MFFDISLYVALAICAAGLGYKVWMWLTLDVGSESVGQGPGRRAASVLAGLARALFSRRIFTLLRVFAVDGLFQVRAYHNSPSGWLAHQLIFWGMVLLVLMHAFDKQVTAALFSDYQSTLNPYLFLREAFGIMIMAGVGLAIYRRRKLPLMRRTAGWADQVALVLLAVVMVSGFLTKAVNITSYRYFDSMVADYSGMSDEDGPELAALRGVWSREFGVKFPDTAKVSGPEQAEMGMQSHQDNCLPCHAAPQWALGSWGLSRVISPLAVGLSDLRAGLWLDRVHFLALFAILALLPFTKFLHLVTSPLMLMAAAVGRRQDMNPAARAFVRAFELDACTHCAACSVHCSVSTALPEVAYNTVLPSEKLAAMARLARRHGGTQAGLDSLREGAGMCTQCHRCTRICPVGIDLQDLWTALSEDLRTLGYPDSYVAARDAAFQAAAASRNEARVKLLPSQTQWAGDLSADARSFANCYQCMTCTNACPVVFQFPNPQEHLDLLPHQIMRALGLGLKEEAMGARMTWTCLTCYRCQEECPQGVQVTEVLNELRNLSFRDVRMRG